MLRQSYTQNGIFIFSATLVTNSSEVFLSSLDIIASGGVTSIDDIKKLRDMNMYGAIIGKALYDKKLDLKEVIDLC